MRFNRSQSIFIVAKSERCFNLCANVGSWPQYMPAVRRGRRVEGNDTDEIIELEAESGDQLITWLSRRQLDPASMTIAFERIAPKAPFIAMAGLWTFLRVDNGCEVRLQHCYSLTPDSDPNVVERIISGNVTRDLEGMKTYLEGGG